MIKELAKIVRDLAYFTELGRRNHDEIKDLRKSHNDLSLSIKLLAMEMGGFVKTKPMNARNYS